MKLKIITIIGARPQFIKASAVSRIIRSRADINEIIVHTGQHFDTEMSAIFFRELDIPEPDYNLGVGNLSHGAMTGRQLEKIEKVLMDETPNMVLVYGDTNSTLAGALAAVKLHIKVAHVEAGLRSFNREMPEEINRILTDHASDILFAPTKQAAINLKNEGVPDTDIFLTGDVMYDAALYYSRKAEAKSDFLQQNNLKEKEYILATVHRAENTDSPGRLKEIIRVLIEVNRRIIPVVLPLHPRTRQSLEKGGLLDWVRKNMVITPPVGFINMVMLEKNAKLIITDSGGVQKEAYFHKVPCITLRQETEWTELVECGWNHLEDSLNPDSFVQIVENIIAGKDEIPYCEGLYGNGDAAKKIVDHLGDKVNS